MDLAAADEPTEISANELHQPIWSVISFDRREAVGLTYDDASRKLEELENKRVAGLCIVTDQAAARTSKHQDGKR